MVDLRKSSPNIALYHMLILCLHLHLLETKEPNRNCPIGFELVSTKSEKDTYCYSLKGPEPFTGKYDGCTGNLFTLSLYNTLNLPKTTHMLWTDYKSLPSGGPFIDWSYTETIGDVLKTTYKVSRNPFLTVDVELCVAVDPVNEVKLTAVSCNEKHYRYCIINTYDTEEPPLGVCHDFDGTRFSSPMQTCLVMLARKVTATWSQSEHQCMNTGGSIIGEGWRYSNYFSPSGGTSPFMCPLDIAFNTDKNVTRYFGTTDVSKVSPSDWFFKYDITKNNNSLGAVNSNGDWELVNSSYIFSNIICEIPIALRHVNLTVSIRGNLVTVGVNDTTLEEDNIYCFTDSSSYKPDVVSIEPLDSSSGVYVLQAVENGYYWCTHIDSKIFYISESNKVLYVKNKESTENLYALKIQTYAKYGLDDISNLLQNVWKRNINEYVFYSNIYNKTYVGSDSYNSFTILRFKKEHPYEGRKKPYDQNLKMIYLDGKTALLHVKLDAKTKAVKPGVWENITIVYMKPVYYCDMYKNLTLGMTRLTDDRQNYTCVGDYNNGVETLITKQDKSVHEMEQELKDLIKHMEYLLYNSSEIIQDKEVHDVYSKLNNFLNVEDLKIPGKILHLLDEFGAKADIYKSNHFSFVKENIAILAALAQPSLPVTGLRIASRSNTGVLTGDTFEILRENISSSQPTHRVNLMVVLPASVHTSMRRVSFVVFRNGRAFQSGYSKYSVNSRIVSVNVENATEFEEGQEIDIHLMPFKDPQRNQSEACAHWQFYKDYSGEWSQKGCMFIKAAETRLANICRCNHLTHFAEILVPRTLFSKTNEAALEIISIFGCFMSILGLIFVGLTAALFRSWRRDFTNKIRLQLCTSIFLLSVGFLIIAFVQFSENGITCMLTGVLLHYSVLASFCWMLMAAVLAYRKLVVVHSIDGSHKLLRASAFAWGTPCTVVGILLLVAPQSYVGQYDDKYPSRVFCYPSGLAMWLTVYAPITVIVLLNLTLFGIIMRAVFTSYEVPGKRNVAKDALRRVSVSCVLVFLFGLPWIFGLFPFSLVLVYLFTIFVTLQGFFLFLFFVLGNKKTRDLWLVKLKIKQMTTPFLSMYSNRSGDARAYLRTNSSY